MKDIALCFNEDSLNRLFPFYILVSPNFEIINFGSSLGKVCHDLNNTKLFSDLFKITRPYLETFSFQEIVSHCNSHLVLQHSSSGLNLRGQFELMGDNVLFVGSPWFTSMVELMNKGLTFEDFAPNDPSIDLLHVLNNADNTSKELKELLTTINEQKNKLKQANKEIQDIALFPTQNPDPLIRIDTQGNLLKRNPAAEKLTTFVHDEIEYATEAFFKHIASKIDFDTDRWIFEAQTNSRDYSFVCKTLKDLGYVNIYGRDVTEQKKSQEEINRLSLVASTNINAVIFTALDGTINWANEGFVKLTGFSLKEAIGSTTEDLFQGALVDQSTFEAIKIAKAKGEHFSQELIHYKKDSTWFWAKAEGQPLFDSEGNVKEYFALIEDITAKKEDEEELKRLSLVASLNNNGIVFTKPNGKIFWCNDAYTTYTGYSKDEIIGKTPVKIGRTSDIDDEQLDIMVSSFYNGFPFDVELKHGRKDGSSFWVKAKGQPILDANGEVTQFFAMIEDISLKKRYDESLQIEKEKYRGIIANMNLGLLEVDLDNNITMANHGFTTMSGYTQQELIGNNAIEIFVNENGKNVLKTKDKLRSDGLTDSYELQVYDKNKKERIWLISGAPNYDLQGNLIGSIGIHLDITDQKNQEQQLYLLSLIAEKNLNSVIIADRMGRIEWANASFLRMSGYSKDEIIGQRPGALLQGPESNPEVILYLRNQIKKGLPFNCEIINYSKNKEKYWVRIQGQALYDKAGKILKYFAIEEDVTAQKELESQKENLLSDLAKTNKELEDYAQIVSHDLKSPLRSINSLITWIKEENVDRFDAPTQKYFSLIEHKVEKMDHLIEGILTYSKIDKEAVKSEIIDTHEIVQGIIDIIHLPDHISVSILGTLPSINADKFRIQQLFQNLIGNAVNYIDKSQGLVEISAVEDGDNYIFSIKDNGVGMPKAIHSKIFETFKSFTTSKHSTGLGLSIVKKIITFYQGEIWLESEEGVGTTFFVKLKKES
nr:PAS domain S-box protein [uncultured Flavobacterium sp.]